MGTTQDEQMQQALIWRTHLAPSIISIESELLQAIAGCHQISLERLQLRRALLAVKDARKTLDDNIASAHLQLRELH